jgi:hypothetical protein
VDTEEVNYMTCKRGKWAHQSVRSMLNLRQIGGDDLWDAIVV